MSAGVATPPQIEVSYAPPKEADYEDDFEDELDSFIATKEDEDNKSAKNKQKTDDTPTNSSSDSQLEKGSEEIEKGQKEYSGGSTVKKNEGSDHEGDDYMFSDDQQRAMKELMAQRQENEFQDEDPPEYDVKDRLIQLNAELAQESAPEEREHKVVFKETLVDLVAPPPDFSDDDDSQRDKASPAEPKKVDDSPPKSPEIPEKKESAESKKKQKTVVVERDGKFEVVNIDDLTPSEREIYDVRDTDSPVTESRPKKTEKNNNNSNLIAQSKKPSPPTQPRPATANGQSSRRQLRPVQSKQRPKSATPQSTSSHETSLENFNYDSPYALSPKQKELADQRAKALEERKREEEKRKKKEKDAEEQENEEAFRAWLKQKQKEQKERNAKESEEQKKKDKEDKEDSEAAFKEWMKAKRSQMKKEKLLKRRQEQEMRDCYHTVSRDDCERAYKEWLKKKNSESRMLRASEKQRSRSARTSYKRSRKNAALLRAIRNSQSFQYVDYYGYKF